MIGELAGQGDEAVAERLQLRGVVAEHVVEGLGRGAALGDPHELHARGIALEQDVEPRAAAVLRRPEPNRRLRRMDAQAREVQAIESLRAIADFLVQPPALLRRLDLEPIGEPIDPEHARESMAGGDVELRRPLETVRRVAFEDRLVPASRRPG